MIEKKSGNTVTKIWELATPLADEQGVEIWDVRYEKEGSNWYLRVFIDKADGIYIEDCEKFSRPFNITLDEVDVISGEYIFEVCSPGLGRTLKRPAHFEKYIGEEIKVKFIRAVDGVKELTATLCEYIDGSISVKTDEAMKTINLSDVSSVKLNDDAHLFD